MQPNELKIWIEFHVERFPETGVIGWGKWWRELQRKSITLEKAKEATRMMADDSSLVPARPRGHPAAVAKLAKSDELALRIAKQDSSTAFAHMHYHRDQLRAKFPVGKPVYAGPRRIAGTVHRYNHAKAVVRFVTPIKRGEGREQIEGTFDIKDLEARTDG